jgi:hypothetical protein
MDGADGDDDDWPLILAGSAAWTAEIKDLGLVVVEGRREKVGWWGFLERE